MPGQLLCLSPDMFQMSTDAAAAAWMRGLAQIVRAWRRLCHCRNWGRAVFLGAGRMSWGCTRHAALVEVVEVAEVAERLLTRCAAAVAGALALNPSIIYKNVHPIIRIHIPVGG